MELDDLKVAWVQLDRRVQTMETRARLADETAHARRLRRPLWFMGARQAVLVAIGLVVAMTGGSFWFEHRDTLHLLLAGVSIHLYGVIMIVAGSVQLAMIAKAHDSSPVVEFQARAARLRQVRILTGLVLGLPWWIIWITAAMVGASMGGVDLYARASAWVWWNLAIGAAGMAVCWVIAHRIAAKRLRSPWVRAVVDSLTGRNMREVACDLDDVKRFAADESQERTGAAARS